MNVNSDPDSVLFWSAHNQMASFWATHSGQFWFCPKLKKRSSCRVLSWCINAPCLYDTLCEYIFVERFRSRAIVAIRHILANERATQREFSPSLTFAPTSWLAFSLIKLRTRTKKTTTPPTPAAELGAFMHAPCQHLDWCPFRRARVLSLPTVRGYRMDSLTPTESIEEWWVRARWVRGRWVGTLLRWVLTKRKNKTQTNKSLPRDATQSTIHDSDSSWHDIQSSGNTWNTGIDNLNQSLPRVKGFSGIDHNTSLRFRNHCECQSLRLSFHSDYGNTCRILG